jgi:two-component system response regulator MprA
MIVEGDPSDSVGLRVLVVDDDADVRLLCRLNLMSEGHHVLEAASGVDALALMHAARPDVVVLDLMMPRVDGLEVSPRAPRGRANAELANRDLVGSDADGRPDRRLDRRR